MNAVSLHRPVNQHLLRVWQGLALAGGVTVVFGLWWDPVRTWANLLLVSFLAVGVGLAGALFVALLYVTSAGWGVVVRRVPEALTVLIPFGGAALLVILLAGQMIYPWTDAQHTAEFPPFKQAWLSWPFFLARAVVFVLVWTWLARCLVRNSRRQDREGGVALTHRNVRLSALFLVVFGVTIWLASSDWLMSLEPDWSSTIFGPYNFAGLFLGGLALTILLVFALEAAGPLRGVVSREHYHDLGKLLFAFSIIWAYFWFCQYMLIWYANIAEEIPYYTRRLYGAWQPLMVASVLLNWAVPFLVLLPRPMKRSRHILPKVCALVLLGRWLDLYLLIFPALPNTEPIPSLLEVGILAGGVGLCGWLVQRSLMHAPLIPQHDPYLAQSLNHHTQGDRRMDILVRLRPDPSPDGQECPSYGLPSSLPLGCHDELAPPVVQAKEQPSGSQHHTASQCWPETVAKGDHP
jgi:hypothetical protein